jgi:hypothetical protein
MSSLKRERSSSVNLLYVYKDGRFLLLDLGKWMEREMGWWIHGALRLCRRGGFDAVCTKDRRNALQRLQMYEM